MSGKISLWLHTNGFMVVHREEVKFGDTSLLKGILIEGFLEDCHGTSRVHAQDFPALAQNFGWEEFDRAEDLDDLRDEAEYFLWDNLGKTVEDPGYFTEDSTWAEDHIWLGSHLVSCCLGMTFGYIIGEYTQNKPSMDIVKRLQVLESSFMPYYSCCNSVGRFIDVISKLRQDIHSNLS